MWWCAVGLLTSNIQYLPVVDQELQHPPSRQCAAYFLENSCISDRFCNALHSVPQAYALVRERTSRANRGEKRNLAWLLMVLGLMPWKDGVKAWTDPAATPVEHSLGRRAKDDGLRRSRTPDTSIVGAGPDSSDRPPKIRRVDESQQRLADLRRTLLQSPRRQQPTVPESHGRLHYDDDDDDASS